MLLLVVYFRAESLAVPHVNGATASGFSCYIMLYKFLTKEFGPSHEMSTTVPPLKGDGRGVFRIVIHGNSGTGKTTLSDRLGQVLNLPVIHLDEIHWRPNWTEAPEEEMVEELRAIIDKGVASNTGWIVDGNYENCTKRIMDFEATDLICRCFE
jgi:hypothetical protein